MRVDRRETAVMVDRRETGRRKPPGATPTCAPRSADGVLAKSRARPVRLNRRTVHRRADDPYVQALATRFGEDLQRCRTHAGMSQRNLAHRAGVSQTLISRLERGVAPWSAVLNLFRLNDVLGRSFPLGTCPHDRPCAYQRETWLSAYRMLGVAPGTWSEELIDSG
jgi:transcriptional regulator with XRE-family HTH domain